MRRYKMEKKTGVKRMRVEKKLREEKGRESRNIEMKICKCVGWEKEWGGGKNEWRSVGRKNFTQIHAHNHFPLPIHITSYFPLNHIFPHNTLKCYS